MCLHFASSPAVTWFSLRAQVCRSVAQLQAAASRLHAQLDACKASPRAQGARCWLPFHYAPLPVDSAEVAHALQVQLLSKLYVVICNAACGKGSALQAGRIYILGEPESTDGNADGRNCAENSSAPAGVVMLVDAWDSVAPAYKHALCGVLANSAAAVNT